MPISKKADHPEFQQMLADAWLNIQVDNDKLFNPLEWPHDYDEFPEKYLTWVLTRPEYFSFICSEILNVHIIPTQALMLKEMWNRKFPMLIASRGFGKSYMLAVYALLRILLMPKRKVVVAGAAFRQSKVIFEYMENIYFNAPRLRDIIGTNAKPIRHDTDLYRFRIGESVCTAIPIGDGSKIRGQRANDLLTDEFACLDKDSIVETKNGFIRISDFDKAEHQELLTGNDNIPYEIPKHFIKTPLTNVYEIKLANGYIIKCSKNHKVMTNNGWKTPKQLSSDDYIEQCESRMTHFADGEIDGLDKNLAWLMGILVSEGCITNKYQIQVKTTDIELCSRLVNDFGFKFKLNPEYIDDRGWKCQQSYSLWLCDKNLRDKLFKFGLDYVTAHDKKVPWSILKSPEHIIQSFLCGLFDGDGSCFLWQDKDIENRIGLAYYSVSERLCRDVQFLMYKLGFDGYINNRRSEISDNQQWFVRWNNKIARDASIYLDVNRFNDVINKCSIPDEPLNYCWDSSRNKWKTSIVYCGKILQKRFKYEADAKHFVQEVRNRKKYKKVVSVNILSELDNLYDYYLPQTNSFYAETFRQHNSIPKEIFENVLAGFAAVKSHPIDSVKEQAAIRLAKKLEIWEDGLEEKDEIKKDNQIIISGTAYYDFNHFGQYWRDWHEIICSRGDKRRLEEYFRRKAQEENKDSVEVPEDFNWKDYSIIRIPFEQIPYGFMDAAQVARSRATIHAGIYLMEFGACFSTDSNGFFKRTLIESCVAAPSKPISLLSGDVYFEGMLHGNPNKRYVYGVDPASEIDNFSIVVVELNPDHRRIVYGWTTNREQHKAEVKAGLVTELDFYSYCAKKIRGLMRRFPCERIMMDSQGGGIAVMEALHDPDKIDTESGEKPIWPVKDPEKPQDTDVQHGLHLVELVNFASADWTHDANHGLRKDMEDKILLFPYFDPVTLANAAGEDKITGRKYDTLEDCVMEIEDLKDELSTIIITQTTSGRDKWDTPEVKLPGGKKGRLRKDRYSALLMANAGARQIQRTPLPAPYETTGGFAQQLKNQGGPLYTNEYYSSWAEEFYRNI